MRSNLVVAVVGPTGVGKTGLAVRLCQALPGEIVSADSRQVYRHMDIGTAKPRREEQAAARHHLIDILVPDDNFGLAEFQERAYRAIEDVLGRGLVPLLVGGTGQYVRAVLEGWRIPRVPPDPALREQFYAQAEAEGRQALFERLLALDPAAGELIDPRNVRRVVRALEVCLKSGRPFSEQRGKHPPPFSMLRIGLTMERDALYRRIDARIDDMVARGLVREVQGLLQRGYDWSLPALSSLGYGQFKGYLNGEATLEEAVALVKKDTRRFIRQQYTWFRLDDPDIHWFDAARDPYEEALSLIRETLRNVEQRKVRSDGFSRPGRLERR